MSLILLQASPPTNNEWMMYGLVGVAGMYIVLRYMSKKRKKDPLADAPVRFGLSQHKSVEREMQNLLVELSNMARQMTSQIDTRSAKLDALIREADEKIAELRALESAMGRSSAQQSVDSYRLPIPSSTPSSPVSEDDPRHAPVYRLADQGKTSPQIATELGRPNGEIELILALRGKKQG